MVEVKSTPMVGSYRFDGQNYLHWSQCMLRILKGRSELDHIEDGESGSNEPNFEIWDNENSLVVDMAFHSPER